MGIAPRARALGATLALALGLVLLTPVGPALAAAESSHSQPAAASRAAAGHSADAIAPLSRVHHLTPPSRVRDGLDATPAALNNHADATVDLTSPAGEPRPPITEAVDTVWARGPPTEELV